MTFDDLIIDNFAGAGGASEGIRQALGRDPDIAVNHDPTALLVHRANHPRTMHLCGDVWEYAPKKITGGRKVGLAWFSPTCTSFSRAKGSALLNDDLRALPWVAVRWAREAKPRLLIVENVPEFEALGPLADGRPVHAKKGITFRRWVADIRRCGYAVEWRVLRACDYGAPTSRRRLFVVARRDGEAIVWPEPTHGPGLFAVPFRTARECIDWSIPCPSIFGRSKPLAEPTQRRIARGLARLASGRHALIQTGYGERDGQAPRVLDLDMPLGTIVAQGQKHALVETFVNKHFGGHEGSGASLDGPLSTITTRDHHGLVVARRGEHAAACRAWLDRYIGPGALPHVEDIGMRMLSPRELATAQGFPSSYDLTPSLGGKPLGVTAQVRMVGNSVSPPVAEALVRANVGSARKERVA